EGYHAFRGQERLASIDLHFTSSSVHCTLILERDLERGEVAQLIERIDEDLVLSADTPRDDLLVNVFRGTEVGFFTDTFHAGEAERVAGWGAGEDDGGSDGADDEGWGRRGASRGGLHPRGAGGRPTGAAASVARRGAHETRAEERDDGQREECDRVRRMALS